LENASATVTDAWTVNWTPNVPGAYPGLYVLVEIQSQAVRVNVSGCNAGDASVSCTNGLTLSSTALSSVVPLAGLPIVTNAIDLSTPGLVNLGITRSIHTLAVAVPSGIAASYVENRSTVTRYLHVYTPAYFAKTFASGAPIGLTFSPPAATVTASSDSPAGTPTGSTSSATGAASDVFSNFVLEGS
jgi:hypothetical protein